LKNSPFKALPFGEDLGEVNNNQKLTLLFGFFFELCGRIFISLKAAYFIL